MTGETMREIGVLLLVFAPLDALFARDALTKAEMAVIVVLSVLFIVIGITLELE
jgi:hypothetical protein